MTSGFEVFVQEVMAAITTDPWESSYSFPSYVNLEDEASLSSAML
jgi:hypothetical protein